MTEPQQREAVLAESLTWLHPHTPFQFSACLKGIGVACGPFLIECYRPYAEDMGLTLPGLPPPFPKDWAFHTRRELLLEVVSQFAAEVPVPKPGDIALFRLGAPTRPFSHGSLVIEWPNRLIHAMWGPGVVYSSAYELPLRPDLARFFSPWAFKVAA